MWRLSSLVLCLAALPSTSARVDTSSWVGTAYTPSGASNTMWWPWYDRYAAQIDRELAAAARHLRMNTLRVFLHPKVYEANASGLMDAVDRFLTLASSHGFGTGLVLFDSCWNTDGSNVSAECTPRKGVHNGCWYEGPEEADKTSVGRFQPYTEDTVRRFGRDARVRWLEIYNEPRGPRLDFVMALRDAAYGWATALQPTVPVISCWDDNNDTQVLDHHDYSPDFASSWQPALYANLAKGAVVTEGGSRWYQPPFSQDSGSPLTVTNFLQALRARAATGAVPFVPGVILNWELMVGNSNTRWHWGSAFNTSEPAIPWDGWLFPCGTPVSYTEAAALRHYITGVDEFLVYDKFLPSPPSIEDGDAYLALPAGSAYTAPPSTSGALGDGVFEASLWLEEGGATALVLRAVAAAPPVQQQQQQQQQQQPTVQRSLAPGGQGSSSSSSSSSSSYRASYKRHAAQEGGGAAVQPAQPAQQPSCQFQPPLNHTDACPGGPVGYRDLSVAAASDPLSACAAACCQWALCTAWVVRALSGTDGNCTDELCCWLKPDCAPSQAAPAAPGTVAAFRAGLPPAPPLPPIASGYSIVLNTSADSLAVVRQGGSSSTTLGSFALRSLENGLVRGAWNLLRVVVATEPAASGDGVRLSVFFNPMFPETGFVGNSSDALRQPAPLPPRLVVLDPTPLPLGGLMVLAGGAEARLDYVSALPLGVL
jgi:hypothetical protein